jgi:hypothetical protein|tara:strand:- start:1781 stop:1987 length:207 start_codon:yes stop_codon:yes gene_type:complete
MSKEALSKPYIQLICHPYEANFRLISPRVTIDIMEKDITRDELVQVLEDFIKAAGYNLTDEQLTIEPV